MLSDAPQVKAVLGPTNTGKTRLAVERMLGHSSGIIGFPLRLLARENYERMVAVKGAGRVALITGEEKIVPAGARWFSCTVEAMPLERGADFIAVDEVQLAADPDRGHVFTERLLEARGREETLFLGAETIRPLLAHLVPDAAIETRPRLSVLSHVGAIKLSRLPPRTAVVAFSASDVYAIAELIRRRRGGAAVVMGRLSPRTRNAQVALYQQKEVDFLVATDAIGMGLNMDVDHVAFAARAKFDGRGLRTLTAAELAQIAGRAGRGMRNGSFGTTAGAPELEDEVVAAIEAHKFPPLAQVCWRNAALDFASLERLLASLALPPPDRALRRGADAADFVALAALARDAEIAELTRSPARVRLLWQTCQIPDFRKLSDESHRRLIARVFLSLARTGRVPVAWIGREIAELARPEGDIDTLMQRLAGIRTWSFIAQRSEWLANAAAWQEKARETEDLLSEALHERLMSRFVDRRSAHLVQRLEQGHDRLLGAVTRRGEVIVEGLDVGAVEGFTFRPDPETTGADRRLVLRAARRALHSEMPRRVASLVTAEDTEFALVGRRILWRDAAVGRLTRGAAPLKPGVLVLASEFLDGPARERVRCRLQSFVEGRIARELGLLLAAKVAAEADTALRGPVHRLCAGLGIARDMARGDLMPAERVRLKALGAIAGRFGLFVPEYLRPAPLALRATLWALAEGLDETPSLPRAGAVAWRVPEKDVPFAEAMGWLAAGPMFVRLDVAERSAIALARLTHEGPVALPDGLASRLGVKAAQVPAVLRALGFKVLPRAHGTETETARASRPVPLIAPLRKKARAHAPVASVATGPFALLTRLRRP